MWRISLDYEETLAQLREPNVVPIYKGGDKKNPENFATGAQNMLRD